MSRQGITHRYPRLNLEGLEDRSLPSGLGLLSALQLVSGPVSAGPADAGTALELSVNLGGGSLLALRLGSSSAGSPDSPGSDTPSITTSANTGPLVGGLVLGALVAPSSGTAPTVALSLPSAAVAFSGTFVAWYSAAVTAPALLPSLPGAAAPQLPQVPQATQLVGEQIASSMPRTDGASMSAQALTLPRSAPQEAAQGVGGSANEEDARQVEETPSQLASGLDDQPMPDAEGAGLITHFQPSPASPLDAVFTDLSAQAVRLVDEIGYRLTVPSTVPWLLGVVLAGGACIAIRRARSQVSPDGDEIAWSLELAEQAVS